MFFSFGECPTEDIVNNLTKKWGLDTKPKLPPTKQAPFLRKEMVSAKPTPDPRQKLR